MLHLIAPSISQDRIVMQSMVSPNCRVIDAPTHTEYFAHDALFRIADGPCCPYRASKGQIEGEERIAFLDCRNALIWLNEMPDAPGAFRRKRESALSSARRRLFDFEGEPGMTELEVLSSNINGLKQLLWVAWRDLANPLLPPFERREARNQAKQYAVELRRCLQLMEAERGRLRNQSLVEGAGHGFGQPKFRILA
jgi:hypothetical protein